MVLNTDFVVTLIAVISFAGLGTFIRTGLSELIYPFNLFSLIPNIFGSFILGLTKGAGLKNKYINKGIGTGLCGSITTFSSFNYEFNILIISKHPNIPLAILFIIITFSISAIAFYIGERISQYITSKITVSTPKHQQTVNEITQPKIDSTETKVQVQIENNIQVQNDTAELHKQNVEPTVNNTDISTVQISTEQKTDNDSDSNKQQSKIVCQWICIFILMNVIVIPLCFIIDNRLWLACLLAPFGAVIRWYLGLKFNKNDRFDIPIGTLIANIIGSLLLTIVIVISKESEDPRDETILIEAITKGFCGCLSTVSSFVGELFTLQRDVMSKMKEGNNDEIMWKDKMKTCKISVIYFFVTIIIAQMLSSIVNGISIWG